MATVDDYAEYIVEARENLKDIEHMCLHGVVDNSRLTYAHIEEEVAYMISRLRRLQNWATQQKETCKSR